MIPLKSLSVKEFSLEKVVISSILETMSNPNPNPNRLSFDLKAMMSDPAKMAQFQSMIQSRLAGDLSQAQPQAPTGAETPEQRKERLRRELRAKIRQKEMQRQGKSVQVAQQIKEMKKVGVENVDEMVQHIARDAGSRMDARQQKMLKREMEKHLESTSKE